MKDNGTQDNSVLLKKLYIYWKETFNNTTLLSSKGDLELINQKNQFT